MSLSWATYPALQIVDFTEETSVYGAAAYPKAVRLLSRGLFSLDAQVQLGKTRLFTRFSDRYAMST